ncbi:MAG TPA: RNA 2',3'-cyclic phosphodiesterase [Phenylobacterium sp.]
MIRLFAAVAIPPEIRAGLVRRQHSLDEARWREPESLHITLRFFGDVREDVAADLDIELAQAAGPAFELELQGVGAFGEGPDIHAIWAGVEESAPLRQLAARCEQAARRAGLKPEKRHYRPHVTLAYLRRPDPDAVAMWIQANNLLHSPPFAVDSFGLYSSRLGSEGSSYTLEREYPLL